MHRDRYSSLTLPQASRALWQTSSAKVAVEQGNEFQQKQMVLHAECLRRLTSVASSTGISSCGMREVSLERASSETESLEARLGRLKTEHEANEKVRKHVAGLFQQLQDEKYLRAKLEAQLGVLEYAAEQQALEIEAAKQHRQSANEERLREHRQFAAQLAMERQQTETLRQEASIAQQEAARFQAEAQTAHEELIKLTNEAEERAQRLQKEKDCLSGELSACRGEIVERTLRIEQQAARLTYLEEELRNERQLAAETEERRSQSVATLAREKKEQLQRYEQMHQSLQQRLAAVTAELNELKIQADHEPGRLRRLLQEKNQETEDYRASLERATEEIQAAAREMQEEQQEAAKDAAAREANLLQEISALRAASDEKVQALRQELDNVQQKLTRAEASNARERKGAESALQRLQRVSEDLDGQTTECERLREDLSALEQTHRQVLQQLQEERESLARHMQQQRCLEEELQERASTARTVASSFRVNRNELLQVRSQRSSRLREKLRLYKHLFRSVRLKAVQLQHEREALMLHLKALRKDGAKAICELLSTPRPSPPPFNPLPHQRVKPNLVSKAAAHDWSSHTVQSSAATQKSENNASQVGQHSLWLEDVQKPDRVRVVAGSPLQWRRVEAHQGSETHRNVYSRGLPLQYRDEQAITLDSSSVVHFVPFGLEYQKPVPSGLSAESHGKTTKRCPLHGLSNVPFAASPSSSGLLV
ncbi:hypothetical protein Esti_001289 [Eimeria stiedai]